ncbi:MAG: TIGR00282 family metallophosphoesterase [Akkermansia sp.]|nr:TIGR00282 family metallophosphoesterase [Akkermansia sp.]
MITILFIGDVVGEPGRTALKRMLPELKSRHQVDFVVVNGENAAAGRGITPKLAIELLNSGVDVITMGDHVWDQVDLAPWLDTEPRVLRPLNYPVGTPGNGAVVLERPWGKVGVLQVQGRSFIQPPLENPFLAAEAEVQKMRESGVKVIFVDIHAETTSEKIALGYDLDGSVSAVVGTHTHVQTADEKVLEGGTAYLTDAGMCGPFVGILGREREPLIKRFRSSMPTKFPVANWPVQVCGAVIQVDESTGRAVAISRINELVEKESQA